MANGNNDRIQSAPSPPPNGPTITEADRARVYAIVGRELNNILNGPTSYYPDSVQKSSRDLTSELENFVGAVSPLRGLMSDPADIVGELGADLGRFVEMFKSDVRNDVETMWHEPRDLRDQGIRLPEARTPTTDDHNIIYVDPEPTRWFPAPNPIAPKPRERRASTDAPMARTALPGPPAGRGDRSVGLVGEDPRDIRILSRYRADP